VYARKGFALANRVYSRRELIALIRIEAEYGAITYQNPALIEQLFFERTGMRRASGPLYMAMWRIKRGEYKDVLSGSDIYTPELPLHKDDSSTVTTEGRHGY